MGRTGESLLHEMSTGRSGLGAPSIAQLQDTPDPAIVRARVMDFCLAAISLTLMVYYIVWYYSYRWTCGTPTNGQLYHRLDILGQKARVIFARAVCCPEEGDGNVEANIAIQAARNPITAQAILATGAVTGATTLVNILLDRHKMLALKELGQNDPLTGKSDLINPELKITAAIVSLLLSFFSLVQSLRLFVHMGFFVRAASYCSMKPDMNSDFGDDFTEQMHRLATRSTLRAQTFFSLGLRFLYTFIPFICWLMGGTYMLLGSMALVASSFFVLDHI